MDTSFIKFITDIMSNDAIAAIMLITLLSVWWLSWKFVVKPIIDSINAISIKIEKYFNSDEINKIQMGINKIKENQLADKNISKDIEYIIDFIKTNTNLIQMIKDMERTSSDIILTKENLFKINDDLNYLRKYIDVNFDNHKRLSDISDQIKEILRYIEKNNQNVDGKYMESALKLVLEGLGSQTRSRFDKNDQ